MSSSTITTTDFQYDIYHPSQFYPWWCINYFLVFHISAKLVQFLCMKLSSSFRALDPDKRCNVIVYVMQILGTTVALVAQIYGGWDLIFHWQDTTSQSRLNSLVFAALMIAILFTWELIYRTTIGWPLLLHHIVTIVLIQFAMASHFDANGSTGELKFATLLGMTATTEQATFVALLLYRLDYWHHWQATWFYVSSIQSLVCKSALVLTTAVYGILLLRDDTYGMSAQHNSWDKFWCITYGPLLFLLFASQVYACYILWQLGRRCQIRDRRSKKAMALGKDNDDGDIETDQASGGSIHNPSSFDKGDLELQSQSQSPPELMDDGHREEIRAQNLGNGVIPVEQKTYQV